MLRINYDSVKNLNRTMICSEHRERPNIKVIGDKITADCCCDKFKKRVELAITKEVENSAVKSVDKELKKMLDKFK